MKLFLLLLLFITPFQLRAQTVSGRVVDSKQQPISFANVTLQKIDSVFVAGGTTADNGRFTVKTEGMSNCLLVVSFTGYEVNVIRLDNLSKRVDVGDIVLQESTVALNEVAVTASRIVNKIDRQIIMPSQMQISSSSSGYDLLNRMMLPNLKVNLLEKTVSAIGGGSVEMRINDIKATTAQVTALQPGDVLRVEYIDEPGVRYGNSEVSAVINFIVKRRESGVDVGVNFTNALTTGFGDDNVYVKANHKKSEFGLNYTLSYRNYKDRYVDDTQQFLWDDDQYRTRYLKGISVPFEYNNHDVELSYNLTNPDKQVFNVVFRTEIYDAPKRDFSQLLSEKGQPNKTTYTAATDQSNTPVLDLYYRALLPKKQSLTMNIVGTYINSDYSRDYKEYENVQNTPLTNYEYSATGSKYSLIGEAIYDKTFKPFKWSVGLKHSQAFLENKYQGTTGDVETNLNTANSYLYTQIQGKLSSLNYMLGVGVSRQAYGEEDEKFTFYTFQPSLMLSYPVMEGGSLRYNFSVTPYLPSLSALSDVRQQIDELQVNVGNPNLKPYRSYNNTLRFQYGNERVSGQVSGSYSYRSNPIMGTVERSQTENGYLFLYKSLNQKSFSRLNGQAYVQVQILPGVLSLTGFGGINRYFSRGNDYTHYYTNWYGGAQLEASLGNWSLSTVVQTRENSLYGEVISYGEKGAVVNVGYRIKNIHLGAGVYNPFIKEGWSAGSKQISKLATSNNWTYIKDNGNMLILTFSWNLNYGRKHEAAEKKLDNSDTDSGIVK